MVRVWDVHMRHFIGTLGQEDATSNWHRVPRRLFKITEDLNYPCVEHPVLLGDFTEVGACDNTTIWHMAYCPNIWEIKKRYDNHMKKSNIHSPEYLDEWKDAHLLGFYPKSEVNVLEIPEVILNEFGINKDKYYFKNRGIEVKHSIMVKQWNDYFKPSSVLDLGCGRVPYLYFWKWYSKAAAGMEISQWAVDHQFTDCIIPGDVSDESKYTTGWDLVTAIDVLEHLDDDKLNKTLSNMAKYGKRFLFSIPFIGDTNLMADSSHLQIKTKKEWEILIESYGIKIKETPKDWLFSNQILIGEKCSN